MYYNKTNFVTVNNLFTNKVQYKVYSCLMLPSAHTYSIYHLKSTNFIENPSKNKLDQDCLCSFDRDNI